MDSIFNTIYYYFPNTPIQVTIRQIIKALLDAIINAKYALVAKGGIRQETRVPAGPPFLPPK